MAEELGREVREQRLEERIAILEKLIASLLINKRNPLRRGWVHDIFRSEYLGGEERSLAILKPHSPDAWIESYLSNLGAVGPVSHTAKEEFERAVSELADLDKLAATLTRLQIDYIETLTALSEAPELAAVPMRRLVQASVYIAADSEEGIAALNQALPDAFDAMECDLHAAEEPKLGSWFRRMWGRTRQVVTSDAVVDAASKLERAAEIKILDGPQHDADLKAAKAVRELAKAFEAQQEAVALIGSLCVLKRNGRMFASTLTQEQLVEVRKNPSWLHDPKRLEDFIGRPEEDLFIVTGNSVSLGTRPQKKKRRLPKEPES